MTAVTTFGVELYMGDGASPQVYTRVAGVTGIPSVLDMSREAIDTTELKDQIRNFVGGVLDPGTVTFDLNFDAEEATHDETTGIIGKMQGSGAAHDFYIKVPGSVAPGSADTFIIFTAVVTSLSIAAGQGAPLSGSATLKISGLPVFAASAP